MRITIDLDYDKDSGSFYGRVSGANSVVTFHGITMEALLDAFKVSIDDYVLFCKERGLEPEFIRKGD